MILINVLFFPKFPNFPQFFNGVLHFEPHLIELGLNILLNIISWLINLFKLSFVSILSLDNLVILSFDEFNKFFPSFGNLVVFFHFIIVFTCRHDNNLKLIIILHPSLNQSMAPKLLKNVTDLEAFKIKISPLFIGDDPLFVFYLLVWVYDNCNYEINHKDVQ